MGILLHLSLHGFIFNQAGSCTALVQVKLDTILRLLAEWYTQTDFWLELIEKCTSWQQSTDSTEIVHQWLSWKSTLLWWRMSPTSRKWNAVCFFDEICGLSLPDCFNFVFSHRGRKCCAAVSSYNKRWPHFDERVKNIPNDKNLELLCPLLWIFSTKTKPKYIWCMQYCLLNYKLFSAFFCFGAQQLFILLLFQISFQAVCCVVQLLF